MYLGIDLGTSEVKALVIDENNEVIAKAGDHIFRNVAVGNGVDEIR